MQRTQIEYVRNPDGTPGFNWAIMTGCMHPCRDQYCYNTVKATAPLNRFYKKNRGRETGELHGVTPREGNYPYGFDPTYYRYRLEEPMHRKKASTIFVANAADIFGEWVPNYIIHCILDVIKHCPQHTFILLTKNYGRLFEFEFPDNVWVGMSWEWGDRLWCSMERIKAKTKFISFEPLHSGWEYDKDGEDGYLRYPAYSSFLIGTDWVIIGSETGPRTEQMRPKREWVMTLVKLAQDQGIPVWMKNNLAPEVFDKKELIQELPKGVK